MMMRMVENFWGNDGERISEVLETKPAPVSRCLYKREMTSLNLTETKNRMTYNHLARLSGLVRLRVKKEILFNGYFLRPMTAEKVAMQVFQHAALESLESGPVKKSLSLTP
jgi:hypothetical protein